MIGLVNINKQGILSSNNSIEPYLVLPDGAIFRLILFHIVENGTHLFTSSNAAYCNERGLFSRLQYADALTYDNKWEFYVIQDGIPYRWTQTSAPSAASITGFNAVTGYTKPNYGLAKGNQSNTYFGYNSWWGAAGCWTSFTQNGQVGIPGFKGLCINYLALYARVDKKIAFIENDTVNADQFIEQ